MFGLRGKRVSAATPASDKWPVQIMQGLERLQESRLPTIASYAVVLAVIVIIGLETGFSARDLSAVELAAFLVAA